MQLPSLPYDKPHESGEDTIPEQNPACFPVLVFPDRETNQRIGYDNRIHEPGQVGETVAEGGTNNHDPERVAEAIGYDKRIVPVIRNSFLDTEQQ